jgi:hypothetical protein
MMNVLIERDETRMSLTDMQIVSGIMNSETGKYVLFVCNRKGKMRVLDILEGTIITIHVDKSKEPKTT